MCLHQRASVVNREFVTRAWTDRASVCVDQAGRASAAKSTWVSDTVVCSDPPFL